MHEMCSSCVHTSGLQDWFGFAPQDMQGKALDSLVTQRSRPLEQ